jgi:chromosome segregation ATPase
MSDFLKKFKNVFIVEDENTSTANSATPANATQTPAQSQATPPTPAAESARNGSVSDKFVEILATALEKNNQEGFDYFEFRQSLKNLAKMQMDEATKYKSAYALAQTMGADVGKLSESAKYYLGVLENERSKFGEAHAQQRAKLIGNREDEIKQLEMQIQQKTEQIQQLTRDIEDHRKRGELLRSEINESTVKIETTKADFETTFQSVTAQIEQDIAKIQQHLTTT